MVLDEDFQLIIDDGSLSEVCVYVTCTVCTVILLLPVPSTVNVRKSSSERCGHEMTKYRQLHFLVLSMKAWTSCASVLKPISDDNASEMMGLACHTFA